MYSDQVQGTIPSEYLFYPERVQSKVIRVNTLEPSIPNKSTVIWLNGWSLNQLAGSSYAFQIESRDANNKINVSANDVFRAYFTQSDGGGSQQFAATSKYASDRDDLQSVEYISKFAGQYTVTVKLENDYTAANPSVSTEIIGSPFIVTFDTHPKYSQVEKITKTCIVGEYYTMTIQSRSSSGKAGKKLDSKNDVYTVEFTRSDGKGSKFLTK